MVLRTVNSVLSDYFVTKRKIGDVTVFEIHSDDLKPAPRVYANEIKNKLEVEIPLSEPYPIEVLPEKIINPKRHERLLKVIDEITKREPIELTHLKIYLTTRDWKLYDTVGNEWSMEILVAWVEIDTNWFYDEYLEFLVSKSGEILITDIIKMAIGKTKWNKLMKALTELEQLGYLVTAL